MSRVMVSTTSEEFERRVRLAVGTDRVQALIGAPARRRRRASDADSAGPAVGDSTSLIAKITEGELPDALVFGPGVPTHTAFEVAGHLDEHHPGVSVVLATGIGPDEWLPAMRLGIRDVADPDADVADLRAVLERAVAAATARQRAAMTAPGARQRGRVILVAAPKGGSGKTTVATNIAVGLAQSGPQQTVILDLDLQFGDVATALHLAPEHGLADAVRVSELDAMALKTFLTPHPTGLYALCAPDTPAGADSITSERVAALIELLAGEFDSVVIDTGPGLNESTLAALDHADDAVMVTGMDVPSIRSMRKELDILRELSPPGLTRHQVVNFADKSCGLTVKDVERVTGTAVDIVLPRSKAVALSTNRGVPLLQQGSRDRVGKALRQLVTGLRESTRPGSTDTLPARPARRERPRMLQR